MKKTTFIFTSILILTAIIASITSYAKNYEIEGTLLSTYSAESFDDEVWVGGVRVTPDNKDDVLSDGGSVKYNFETNTLTLKDATIIFRYATKRGTAPEGAWAIRLNYTDALDISDYATDGVMYCTLKGIMKGMSNNNFAPKDNATRAEAAAILHRFIGADKK